MPQCDNHPPLRVYISIWMSVLFNDSVGMWELHWLPHLPTLHVQGSPRWLVLIGSCVLVKNHSITLLGLGFMARGNLQDQEMGLCLMSRTQSNCVPCSGSPDNLSILVSVPVLHVLRCSTSALGAMEIQVFNPALQWLKQDYSHNLHCRVTPLKF